MKNDLIRRSALTDAIVDLLVFEGGYEGIEESVKRIFSEIPAVDAGPKWISVEERLPELIPCNAGTAYSEAVIVWTNGRKAMVAVWDGIDFLCAADYWEAWGEKITHWMPLPEPPKEG